MNPSQDLYKNLFLADFIKICHQFELKLTEDEIKLLYYLIMIDINQHDQFFSDGSPYTF